MAQFRTLRYDGVMPTRSLTLYHATRAQFETFDLAQTVDGGLHAGTEAQARMRGGRQARLMAFEVHLEKIRRCRDEGGDWARRIKAARQAGCDAIVYLNRYEGIPSARLDALRAAGLASAQLDRLSDAEFKKKVPEAEDSYIILHTEDLYRVRWLPASDAEAAPPADPPAPAAWVPPQAHLQQVTHIGHLDRQDKGWQGPSQEGEGLSFSTCPEAWERIAGLAGRPHWRASAEGWRLLDGHASLNDPQGAATLTAWGQEQGWITLKKAYEVHYWDDELQQLIQMPCADLDEALAEFEPFQDDDDPRNRLVEKPLWCPTAKLCAHMSQPPAMANRPHALALQWVTTVWAQDHDWDGVWWADALKPEQYSAPRGVLFANRVRAEEWRPVSTAVPARRSARPR